MAFKTNQIVHPSSEFRPMPLWAWNGCMSRERITEMLEQFAEQGFGGSFIHPRPGLVNEYLSSEWFELWSFALTESKRLGLQCNIYDENSYPSGFAAGHVADRLPDATATYLIGTVIHPGQIAPLSSEVLASTVIPQSDAVLFVTQRKAKACPWTAWHPPVDTTDPRTAQRFIEITHEAYAKHLGEAFGHEINYVFADEPTWMMHDPFSHGETQLPVSDSLLNEFKKEHGYDIFERVTDLFLPGEQALITRYDYFHTLHRVWTHNFLKPIHNWCEQHQLRFTGHFMEHEWPAPINQGSTMDAMRWMHTPGIDLLGFQYHVDDPGRNDLMLLTVKEVSSVARQLNRERALCETHGGGGHAASVEQFKALTDWVAVHGINLINPHMSVQSLAGARKYDWPQTFSDHSPWFKYLRLYTDHTARITAALTQGKLMNRTLVLHPTTSGWLQYLPGPDSSILNPKIAALRESQATLVQFLADHQIDFDLGDELLMRDFARIEKGKFMMGEAAYDQLVLPPHMETWCESTLTLIEIWLESGGILLATGEPPLRINGRPDPRPAALQKRFFNHWKTLHSNESLYEEIISVCPPRITLADGAALPAHVHHHYRELGDGEALHFLVWGGKETLDLNIRLAGGSLRSIDTATGEEATLPVRQNGTHLTAPLNLPPTGHALWISSPTPAVAEPVAPAGMFQTLENFEPVEFSDPNILMLNYCSLRFRDKQVSDVHVLDADTFLWKALGFPHNIWDRSIQFRNDYSQYTFDDTSGFQIDYRFTARAPKTVLNDIELAVERPHLYRISINDTVLDIADGIRWFDEDMRKVSTAGLLREGENIIRLERDRFDIFCEIDRIYLLGNFSLTAAEAGFVLKPPVTPTIGDWTKQGRPFYKGAARYETQLTVIEHAHELKIRVPCWEGSVIRILLDGEAAGVIGFAPYELTLPAPSPGTHRLGVEVIGDLRNVLGGHFNTIAPSRSLWENHPASLPAGDSFMFIPQGLTGGVEFSVLTF